MSNMSSPTSVSNNYRGWLIAVVIAAAMFLVSLFAAPPLRQAILGGWQAQPASVPTEPLMQVQNLPQVTLAEAQEQVSFPIPVPSWIPTGLELGGAHVNPPNWANIYYIPSDSSQYALDAGLSISIWRGKDTTEREISGVQSQPDILVGDYSAKYSAGEMTGSLVWETDSFTYMITYSGLDLSREELQRLAESLQ